MEYDVKDLLLAEEGRQDLTIAEMEMPGLMKLREIHAANKPLAAARITGSLHMTKQTAVLIETLSELGADIRWASCNIYSTEDAAAAAVVCGPEKNGGSIDKPKGVPVFAWKNESLQEYWDLLLRAFTFPNNSVPNLIVDDGGDATLLAHKGYEMENGDPWVHSPSDNDEEEIIKQTLRNFHTKQPDFWHRVQKELRGVSEETTTGVLRLLQRHQDAKLLFPAINVNDSVTKSKFDNLYGCRESLIDGLKRSMDVMIAGKIAVVCGFGNVGKGCAQSLKAFGARVIVTECDPICALQALMEGYTVTTLEETLGEADIYVTATGNRDVITTEQMSTMKDGAIVCNIGHFDNEIQVHALQSVPNIIIEHLKPQVDRYTFHNGPSIFLLAAGRLMNLGCATGHSSFVMSISFTNQVLAQLRLWQEDVAPGVHLLDRSDDEFVARIHVEALGAKLTTLNQVQSDYIAASPEGPFKTDQYRY